MIIFSSIQLPYIAAYVKTLGILMKRHANRLRHYNIGAVEMIVIYIGRLVRL
jgi:hypothetical protein